MIWYHEGYDRQINLSAVIWNLSKTEVSLVYDQRLRWGHALHGRWREIKCTSNSPIKDKKKMSKYQKTLYPSFLSTLQTFVFLADSSLSLYIMCIFILSSSINVYVCFDFEIGVKKYSIKEKHAKVWGIEVSIHAFAFSEITETWVGLYQGIFHLHDFIKEWHSLSTKSFARLP